MNEQAYVEFKMKREEIKCQLDAIRGLTYIELSVAVSGVNWEQATADLVHVQEILGEAIAFLCSQDESDG